MSDLKKNDNGTWSFFVPCGTYVAGDIAITSRTIGHNYLRMRVLVVEFSGEKWRGDFCTAEEIN